MTKGSRIWLWIALVICILTTIMNVMEGRLISGIIAVIAIIGLCLLLFGERKMGFYLMCICYLVSCIYSIATQLGSDYSPLLIILMSVIGSLLIPGITFLFIRKSWNTLH